MLVKFEQKLMIQTTQNFELFVKTLLLLLLFYNIFWHRVDAILEDVSVAEITV